MITKEAIVKVVEPKIKELEGFLVDVKVNTSNVITVYFDKNAGVSIDDCHSLSKYFEMHFDREIEDYQLTVCSAGLDNPFKVDQQYQKYYGHEVSVLLNSGKRKKGSISSFTDGVLTIESKKKKKGTSRKEYIIEEINIPKSEIKETKVKINFK